MSQPKRRQGRKGGPQEYVQWDTAKVSYIAQQAGSEAHWFVFRMTRDTAKALSTLAGPMDRDKAVLAAYEFALAKA